MSEVSKLFEDELLGESGDNADHPMNFLLEQEYALDFPQAGEIRTGQVISRRNSEILIDIGAKSEGIIGSSEIETLGQPALDKMVVGSEVSVLVVDPEDNYGNIIVSYAKAREEDDWKTAESLLESQEIFEGTVIGYNKGGLIVPLGRIRGFVPASLLASRPRGGERGDSREDRLSRMVGQDLTTRVIEVDRDRSRLIFSERAAVKEARAAERSRVLEQLEEGTVLEGHVVNLADFGAFVDIGGLEGLVHLSELSWKRVGHPSELLAIGDDVNVHVLRIDKERQRVALSLKRLEPDPWTLIGEIYHEGELVEANITKLTKYGAFARIQDDYGLEGLIHISELSDERIDEPQEVVQKGQLVAARIIRIDPEQRQLGLSCKQVASPEYVEADLAAATETSVDSSESVIS